MALNIVFAGTSAFGLPALRALMDHHHLSAVYTKPDMPSGRGRKVVYSPIKQFVVDHYPKIPLLQPVNLKDADTQKQVNEFFADVMVVIAYGVILPEAVFPLFKYGCLNVHASLLPRWRGAAPIQRAMLAGDTQTGVTIMQINAGLDTGDILVQKSCPLEPTQTAGVIHDHLADLGASALLDTLAALPTGNIHPLPQDNALATYAPKLSKEEALINWHQSAIHILRQIKAFNPWPVAQSTLNGQALRIFEAEVISTESCSALTGTIIAANENGIDIATQPGVIRLLRLQVPGSKVMTAASFLNARKGVILPGKTLIGEKIC